MKKNSRRASKTYKEANLSGEMSFKNQIDTRHIEHDSIMLDDGKAVSKIGASADATADSILENFLPYLGWTWSCNCNSTTGDCTCTITNTGGGSGGGGDTVTDVQTSLTGTTLTTSVITDLGTHSGNVDLSSLSGGGAGGEPLYTGDKPGIALNSTEDVLNGVVNLNNGDGSVIPIYATITLDDKFATKVDLSELSNYVLDSVYQTDKTAIEGDIITINTELSSKVDTTDFEDSQATQNSLIDIKVDSSTFENSQEIQNNRISNVEVDLTDLQLMLNSVILEQNEPGPVSLSLVPLSILTFPTVVNAGKYNGAMRATWTGTGLRSVTLTIYVNGVATLRTTTESYTDNQTASLFTATPLDLVEGDVVEVYASSTNGSVEAISGALQLVLSNGTIDLSAYETVADHTIDMNAVNGRVDNVETELDTKVDNTTYTTDQATQDSAISANTTEITKKMSKEVLGTITTSFTEVEYQALESGIYLVEAGVINTSTAVATMINADGNIKGQAILDTSGAEYSFRIVDNGDGTFTPTWKAVASTSYERKHVVIYDTDGVTPIGATIKNGVVADDVDVPNFDYINRVINPSTIILSNGVFSFNVGSFFDWTGAEFLKNDLEITYDETYFYLTTGRYKISYSAIIDNDVDDTVASGLACSNGIKYYFNSTFTTMGGSTDHITSGYFIVNITDTESFYLAGLTNIGALNDLHIQIEMI